ncbi:MAG: hypothetical protein AAFV95_16905 [Bacteroidota bacterium]
MKIKQLLFFACLLMLAWSCAEGPNRGHISYLESTVYKLDLNEEQVLTTPRGLTVRFEEPFLSQLLAMGSIWEVKLDEYYQKDEFFMAGLPTLTDDGQLLESAGMFRIRLFQQGQEVKPENLEGLSVDFPIRKEYEDLSEFQVYNAVVSDQNDIRWTDPVAPDSVWTVQDTTLVYLYDEQGQVVDSIINGHQSHQAIFAELRLIPRNLDWINVDRVVKRMNNELVDFQVQVDPDIKDVIVGIVIDSLNSYLPLYSLDESNIFYVISLPKGLQGFAVGLGNDGSHYQLGAEEFEVGEEAIELQLALEAVSADQLLPNMKALN